MATIKQHVKNFKAAHRLASDILSQSHSGLPDDAAVHHLATAIFANGLKASDGESRTKDYAGQDADSENMLQDSYDENDARS